MLEVEALLVTEMEKIFPNNMIFTESTATELNNELFSGLNDSDSTAVLILSGGVQVDPPVSNKRQQRFKTLWQLVVVCPKELVLTYGDQKFEEIIKAVNGLRIDKRYDYFKAVSDERGFNKPDYTLDLVYIPMLYSTGKVL